MTCNPAEQPVPALHPGGAVRAGGTGGHVAANSDTVSQT